MKTLICYYNVPERQKKKLLITAKILTLLIYPPPAAHTNVKLTSKMQLHRDATYTTDSKTTNVYSLKVHM